jgi:hypothetical protein
MEMMYCITVAVHHAGEIERYPELDACVSIYSSQFLYGNISREVPEAGIRTHRRLINA